MKLKDDKDIKRNPRPKEVSPCAGYSLGADGHDRWYDGELEIFYSVHSRTGFVYSSTEFIDRAPRKVRSDGQLLIDGGYVVAPAGGDERAGGGLPAPNRVDDTMEAEMDEDPGIFNDTGAFDDDDDDGEEVEAPADTPEQRADPAWHNADRPELPADLDAALRAVELQGDRDRLLQQRAMEHMQAVAALLPTREVRHRVRRRTGMGVAEDLTHAGFRPMHPDAADDNE